MAGRTLVLGGARSGKSRWALARLLEGPPPWAYLATAEALDEEMEARVAAHRAFRPPEVATLEEPFEVASVLRGEGLRHKSILLDCLTLWLSNLLTRLNLDDETCEARVEDLLRAIRDYPGRLLIVSNEVGLGIVPQGALTRRFRDLAGRAHQRLAAASDEVVFMVAGMPLWVKGGKGGI